MTGRSILQHCAAVYLFNLLVCQLNAQVSDQLPTDFQQLKEYFDQSYSADYNLWNGRKYQRFYNNSIGHPFLDTEEFTKGDLVIKGVLYENVLINYDISIQQVILEQAAGSTGNEQVVVDGETVDEFSLDGKLFRKMTFQETGTRFFQVVTGSEITCLLAWDKHMSITSAPGVPYSFTSGSRKSYLLVSGQLQPFRSTSSFIELIGKEHKKEIKRFIRQYGIQPRSASDFGLERLLNYCSSLAADK